MASDSWRNCSRVYTDDFQTEPVRFMDISLKGQFFRLPRRIVERYTHPQTAVRRNVFRLFEIIFSRCRNPTRNNGSFFGDSHGLNSILLHLGQRSSTLGR